ncbi:MAG: peptide-methionine (S)-S-oxide reductase MsrA [Pirellulales bacterium]|nr:peptide-methionine (S)-S-oxide reductase MsrA [Pirellulales bacterium]
MSPPTTELATLGGGCFWCLEACYEQVRGVERVVSGYAGGGVPNPSYEQVCGGYTGHAEVVQLTFDPAIITYRDLLTIFFGIHDPTTPNRQGADVGTQYRSVIYTHSAEQETTARELIAELNKEQIWPGPIVTQVAPLVKFFPAEDYHQGYYQANPDQPYCQAVVGPKAAKLRQKFTQWLKA